MTKKIVTDAIKDAIGNDPVLDQYEFDYTSAYIGSTQDDAITGSIVKRSQGNLGNLIVGNRGKSFSAYSSPNSNNIGNTPAEISQFPLTSARLQSNREISSTQKLRFVSSYDDKERWYDSCLPDLFDALHHDGTHIKTLKTSMRIDAGRLLGDNLITSDDYAEVVAAKGATPTVDLKDVSGKNMDGMLSVSPMATVVTGGIGFVTFNVPRLNKADDPSINNEWTWAYPFESKFNPDRRLLKINDVLNLNIANAKVLPALSGNLTKNLFPPTANRQPYSSAPLNLPHQSYYAEVGKQYQINTGIIPVIQGKHETRNITRWQNDFGWSYVNTRNGNRTWNTYDHDSYFYPIGEQHDPTFGYSTTMVGDVILNQVRSLITMFPDSKDAIASRYPRYQDENLNVADLPDWQAPVVANYLPILGNVTAALTSSATKSDLIKFFFGFGDVNNMTYAKHTLDVKSPSYTFSLLEKINDAGNPTGTVVHAAAAPGRSKQVTDDTGKTLFSWQFPNELIDNYENYMSWRTVQWDTLACYAYGDCSYTVSGSGPTTGPVTWTQNAGGTNGLILGSGTPNWAADPLPDGQNSTMYIDVYSDSPWQYTYSRGVAATTASYLVSRAFRVHVHGQTDLRSGSLGAETYPHYDLYSRYDSDPTAGFNYYFLDPNDGYGEMDYVTGSLTRVNLSAEEAQWTSNLYPPGTWRVMFMYHNVDDPVGAEDDINRAFISDLKFQVFGKSAYVPDENYKLGCNNYPEFRQFNCDARNCPKDEDYPAFYFSGISHDKFLLLDEDLNNGNEGWMHTHRNRNFRSTYVGIGPIIRGWKHGLASGFPTYSRAMWRRNRFGQLRDMLEQRSYTKFVCDYESTIFANVATPFGAVQMVDEKIPAYGQIEPGPIDVKFVRRRYKRDERGIGFLYNESVTGELTLSQNTTSESTSANPYVDGIATMRKESDLATVEL